nr:hypothetical protein 12 [Pseudomonadaceae bacterium]
MTKTITLYRDAYTDMGTFGRIVLPTGWQCLTVERPWIGNQTSVSCIPEGVYELRKRRSGVVERTTGGEFKEGWEVTDVPGRTYIMIHPANHKDHLEGCIAPGMALGWINSLWAVTDSMRAFQKLMRRLRDDSYYLDIRPYRVEWP